MAGRLKSICRELRQTLARDIAIETFGEDGLYSALLKLGACLGLAASAPAPNPERGTMGRRDDPVYTPGVNVPCSDQDGDGEGRMPERDWKEWMVDLGQTLRRARELAGLTQAELATHAGISQGGLSRLEQGTGTFAPLVVVLRVLSALRTCLSALPRTHLTGDVSRLLDLPAIDVSRSTDMSEPDMELRRLLEAYRMLSASERAHLVRVATITASALRAKRDSVGTHET